MAGSYWYGTQHNKKQSPATPSNKVASTTSNESGAHYVSQLSYPYDLKDTNLLVKLAIPSEVQAVVISSDNNNRGAEQYFTDKFNDELARFALGYPEDTDYQASELSVLAIGDSWLTAKTDTSPDILAYSEFDMDGPINTPTQKAQYLAKLKKDTATCTTESGKGFKTTGDVPLNVCYELNFGKDGYSLAMTLWGYGEEQNKPIVMFGFIDVYDATSPDSSNFEASHQAIADAQNGKYTKGFKKALDNLLSSLPKTSIEKQAASR